jgi:hypothetical protein
MRALGWLAVTLGLAAAPVACGLQFQGTQGGPDATTDVVQPPMDGGGMQDAIVDISVPDQGQGVTDAGLPCECVSASDLGSAPIVAYASKTRGTCPTGYDGVAGDNVESFDPPSPTTCTCAPASPAPVTPPSCTSQTLNFDIKTGTDNGTCTNNPDFSNSIAASFTCNNAGRNINPGGQKADYVSFKAQSGPTPAGGTCGANLLGGAPVPVTKKLGETCKLSASLGSCGSNLACVPLAPAPWGQCIELPGAMACPASFPFPHRVGSSVTDTRACAACTGNATLTAGTCSIPKITLYSDSACNTAIQQANIDADGMCKLLNWGGGKDARGATYTSQSMGASCAGPGGYPSTVTGQITVADEKKLCCRAAL